MSTFFFSGNFFNATFIYQLFFLFVIFKLMVHGYLTDSDQINTKRQCKYFQRVLKSDKHVCETCYLNWL